MISSRRFPIPLFLLSVVVCGAAGPASSQILRLPRPSQKASVKQAIGATEVTIVYSRPGVKGRTIWGDAPPDTDTKGEATLDNQLTRPKGMAIAPYGHVWRTGANEATQFVVGSDVLINGQRLPAGSYSLHTIPGRQEWTIVFNDEANQWGSFNYNEQKDKLRVKTRPEWVADNQEWLLYTFENVTENSAQVNIRWEKLRVQFVVEPASTQSPQSSSQKASVMQTIGVTDLTLTYRRRPEPNEIATFITTDEVLIGGQRLPAGAYSLQTIPGPDEWTMVFSTGADKDTIRIKSRPQRAANNQDWLTYSFDTVTDNAALVYLRLDQVRVPFIVEVMDVVGLTLEKAAVTIASARPDDWRTPYSAAIYAVQNDNSEKATRWFNQSLRILTELIQVKETFQNLSSKAQVLMAAGRRDEAQAAASRAIAQGRAERVDTTSFEKRFADMNPVARIATPTARIPAPAESPSPVARITAPAETAPAPTRKVTLGEDTTPVTMTAAGRYYALVIGNDRYQYVRGLKMAETDARAVAALLENKYGFSTKLLLNATRQDIISAINIYRRTLDPNDSLLVYYAGHGYYDHEVDRAYWLPVDARPDDNSNWISADDITGNVRGVVAKHVLIVSDSCYSGTISRAVSVSVAEPAGRLRFLQKMMAGKSRTLMASGGNEPVTDGGGGGHSVFARAFLTGLDQSDKSTFTATELFQDFVQERVAGGAKQTPEYSPLRNSGHESGDFVFVRRP
jgi:hypothetical protein